MKRVIKVNSLTWGLFGMNKVKDIPVMLKRLSFVIAHGYYPQAQWNTYGYFIDSMKEILRYYKDNRATSLVTESKAEWSDEEREKNNKSADELFAEMLALLEKMDERNAVYNGIADEKKETLMSDAKNRFFNLFSKYFYELWD